MAAPTITSFSPASLPANAGGQTTITGTGFQTANTVSSVTVNGAAATFSATNDTTLVVTIPNAAPGVATVVVTTDGGSATSNNKLTITNYVIPEVSTPSGLTGILDTTGTSGLNDPSDTNWDHLSKPNFAGAYPSYLDRTAKIAAAKLYNLRYPDDTITVPTY
jgi:hypothetical protein